MSDARQYAVIQRSLRPCLTCGKQHELRRPIPNPDNVFGSWADPFDGHTFAPESWESIGRRLFKAQPAPERAA